MAGKFHHEAVYRGAAAMAKLSETRITLCGAGALGSNLADTLARQGASRLRVIDHGRVEEHNIGTQTYNLSDVGQPKVDALRKQLFRAAEVEIEAVRKELTPGNVPTLLNGSDLIVDCLDNSTARQTVQDFARASGTAAVHAGLFADYGEVVWDEQYRVPRDVAGDVCDYPLARDLVLLTVVVTAEAILRYVSKGSRESRSITLGDLAVRAMQGRV